MRRGKLSQSGAVLIQVGFGMIALMALSALAVDYGVKVAARRAAQNSADAGALAGAIALSYDNPTDKTDSGPAKQSALKFALANGVWGESPNVNVTTDITFPNSCPFPGDTCVRVDVYRNQERNNPLPTFFGNLVGVVNQGVKASATAQVVSGDTTECLKPWVVVDRWDEFQGAETDWDKPGGDPDFGPTSTYDKYSDGKGTAPPQEEDLYVPPSASSTGTGFTPKVDHGRQFAIKVDSGSEISSGWFRSVDLPRKDTTSGGASAYEASIKTCAGWPVSLAKPEVPCPTSSTEIGSYEEKIYWAARGCLRVQTGIAQGPTIDGVEFIIAKDPTAYWDGTTIVSDFSPSPRIVPVGILDVQKYLELDPSGSGGIVRLVNVFGFFIEGMGDIDKTTGAITCCDKKGKAVVGRLISIPGLMTGSSTIHPDASFLKSIILVR
jgi:Flp pilus assembly protein TadG